MSAVFLKIVNMSIAASWLVFAVILLRLVLKKAPRWVSVLLWGFVAVRLICPFTIESALSLIPSTETIPQEVLSGPSFDVQTGIPRIDASVNDYLGDRYFEGITVPSNHGYQVVTALTILWMAGFAAMLIYTAVSYLLLRRKVGTAVLLKENIFQNENVDSPFVLGIIKPKIYLPFRMDGQNLEYVIAHERAHIRRKDHWWKPLGFLLLAIHWFNPLMWIGYILLCRDIELACDEKVIKEMDQTSKADYTQALVACSVNRRSIAACPLAFGEVGVRERVKSVMNYKKPAFWIIIAAIILCVVVAICFLTNPLTYTLGDIGGYDLSTATQENTAVLVSDGKSYAYVGSVKHQHLQKLYDIRISRNEVSLDRGEDRDKSNTLILNLSSQAKDEMITSYAGGIAIHFNADFTAVWINDSVKPTLSYEVLEPEKARSVFLRISNYSNGKVNNVEWDPVETINGNMKTYYKNPDGTWAVNGRTYQHRLVVTGRMPNAAVDSTFVFLSNLETITFDQAWKAAGFSSNLDDYFSAEKAVLVEFVSGNYGSREVGVERFADSATYDIDGDGEKELCQLNYVDFDPAYNSLFCFSFTAIPTDVTSSAPFYFSTYGLAKHYDLLSFEIRDGLLQIRAECAGREPVYFGVTVKDGNLILQNEKEMVFFWTDVS